MGSILKRLSRGKLHKAKRVCPNRVHSDQMVHGIVRREAGPCERRPKVLKSKLAQGGPSELSPLRSDGSQYGQGEGWAMLTVAKDSQGES
jgi:hypothetical protein